jgi:hypothetical protein
MPEKEEKLITYKGSVEIGIELGLSTVVKEVEYTSATKLEKLVKE